LPSEALALVDRLQSGYDAWAGGWQSAQAVELIAAYADNGGTQECVEKVGADMGKGWWAVGTQPADYHEWYAPEVALAPPVRTLTFIASLNAPAARLEPLLHQAPDPQTAEALNKCQRTHTHRGTLIGQMSEEELGSLLRPRVVEDLSGEWARAMHEAVAASGADSGEIWSCFTASDPGPDFAGIDPAEQGGPWWSAVAEQLDDNLSAVPAPGATGSDPAWVKARTMESELTSALWRCHDGDYLEVLTAADTAATQFGIDHADQIAEARSTWHDLRALAAKLGWAPDRPLGPLAPPQP
jgi:hypothetical protein